MTPEQKRIVIALACGAHWQNNVITFRQLDEQEALINSGEGCGYYTEFGCIGTDIPNYLTDLNAMHEAEKVLGPKWPSYCEKLLGIVEPEPRTLEVCHYWNLLHATVAQRADAFIATLNLH